MYIRQSLYDFVIVSLDWMQDVISEEALKPTEGVNTHENKNLCLNKKWSHKYFASLLYVIMALNPCQNVRKPSIVPEKSFVVLAEVTLFCFGAKFPLQPT